MKALIPVRFQRGRLAYEPIRPEHAAELEPLLLDPRVWRNLQAQSEPAPTAADVRTNAVHKDRHWEQYGFGYWLLRDRDSGQVVGRGGLQRTGATGVTEVEIGWAILPERWGTGLATELARVAVGAAFDSLRLSSVIAYTQPDNLASRRVMEKAGLTYEGDISHAGLPHVLYRRDACG
jgi:ribosomal-protein-alanine N-acetyltransferase